MSRSEPVHSDDARISGSIIYHSGSAGIWDEPDGGVGDGQVAKGDITASVFRRLILVFFSMVA